MRVGSLFTGIGGIDRGLEAVGMRTVWQVENDEYCTKILERHWPRVKRYGDVREVHGEDLEEVDLLCGGFPCQTVSLAGLRKGEEDPRWLWPEFRRILREVRPGWALVENVPGLLSNSEGETFAGLLRDLAQSGYDAEWDCIPAAAVGAPHLRYRVFLVAHKVGDTSIEQVRSRLQPGEPLIFAGRKPEHSDWWDAEPDVRRVAPGVPKRVDRTRVLGNSVLPQVASWIGSRILSAQNRLTELQEAS